MELLIVHSLRGVLAIVCIGLSLHVGLVCGAQSDINCLKSLFHSVQDPFNYLSSTWNFKNVTEGSICSFTGVECWHPGENRVLNIKLANMSLKGSFPLGLSSCKSMTGLDLSSNEFSGSLPTNISDIIRLLTSLDLSSNNFSGPIPESLAQVTYLNVLNLDHNKFTGQIPPQFSSLSRIKTFNVANNLLSGQIPTFQTKIPAESFANNPGLCGRPLDNPCRTAN